MQAAGEGLGSTRRVLLLHFCGSTPTHGPVLVSWLVPSLAIASHQLGNRCFVAWWRLWALHQAQRWLPSCVPHTAPLRIVTRMQALVTQHGSEAKRVLVTLCLPQPASTLALSWIHHMQALVTQHGSEAKRVLVTEARDRVGGNITTVRCAALCAVLCCLVLGWAAVQCPPTWPAHLSLAFTPQLLACPGGAPGTCPPPRKLCHCAGVQRRGGPAVEIVKFI